MLPLAAAEPGAPSIATPTTVAIPPTPIADPFLDRLRQFQDREFGQLRQIVQQIESHSDRDACLRLLGARLLELYGRDKRRLKRIRDEYPVLSPVLKTT